MSESSFYCLKRGAIISQRTNDPEVEDGACYGTGAVFMCVIMWGQHCPERCFQVGDQPRNVVIGRTRPLHAKGIETETPC